MWLFLLLFFVSCHRHPVFDARDRIPIGTLRAEAFAILAPQSWYFETCYESEERVEDIFFFGSHKYDDAEIVIVASALEDGWFRVKSIGSFENYIWHTTYSDCIDRERFED